MNTSYIRAEQIGCLLLALALPWCAAGAGDDVPPPPGYRSGSSLSGSKPPPFDIEIVNGQLLLANLQGKVDVKSRWGAGIHSVDASLKNVVEVLRDLHPNANFTLAPELDSVKIGDLKLRASQIDSELEALRVASRNKLDWNIARFTPGQVDPNTGRPMPPPTDMPMYLINSVRQAGRNVEVFNLRPYFEQYGSPDSKAVEESLAQIKEIILQTLQRLNPDEEPPGFQFHHGANLLIVTGSPEAIEVARKVVNALEGRTGSDDPRFGGGFMTGGLGGGGPGFGGMSVPGALAGTNPFAVSKERRMILAKLESIHLDSFMSDGLPLSEVVRMLLDGVKKWDPEKRGINFLIDANQPPAPAPMGSTLPIDPTTGLPAAAPPSEPIDINSVTIRINPGLTNLRLVDVLNAIVRVADHPIKYTVTDYAVIFSLKGPGEPAGLSLPEPGKVHMY